MTRILLSVLGVLVGSATAAFAQASPSEITIASFDPSNAVAPISAVEGPGVKIGEGTVLRPVFGISTGLINNVFYEESGLQSTGVLRLLAQIGTASLGNDRLTPAGEENTTVRSGNLEYRADIRASYDLMLTTNDTVSETGGLGLGGSLHLLTNPSGRWSFGVDDNFVRLIRAANFETNVNTNRDINTLALRVIYHPTDRAVGGNLYFTNTIDIFERDEQSFADRMQNRFGIHPEWRWLPQTTLFADVSMGIFTGLGTDSQKVTSYPLTAAVGIATLLTLKTTFNLHAGYARGFYTSGPDYSSPLIGASLGYRYSPLGRAVLTYNWVNEDSINANFYRDHVVRLWVQQLFVPFVLMVQPEVHFRRYEGISAVMGPPTRDDVIFSVVAGVHYNFRNWLAATLDYRFASVSTNYEYTTDGGMDDPSFTRHELLLGMRFAL